ncbi:zinc finger protein 37 homolog [Galendromus occidentalis]|uniref:Zinc finger protein 37 homolog n=1 Tax=Galendromus occidentalis TaxID=34638 RepID=A0AAJ7WH05_9ACAR|nr:zinc finger protein 37 homolog [Galendromus occidentalis]
MCEFRYREQNKVVLLAEEVPHRPLYHRIGKSDGLRPALENVYADHLLRKPHHCSICFRGFATKQNLKVHFRTHTGERPYGCSICGRRFNQKHVLRDHERTHTGDMPYHCDICIQRFKTTVLPTRLELAPIIIDSMKQIQQALGRGRKSLQPNSGTNRYQCPVCPYSTNKKGHYVVHERVHTGEKPYKCPLCPYRATQKSSVTIHMVVHQRSATTDLLDGIGDLQWLSSCTGAEQVRFSCNQCDYSSPILHYYEKHQRKHLDRSLQCPYCNYVSKQRGHLNQHIKCHTEEKLQCAYCDFKTHWKSNLVRHVAKHHPSVNQGVVAIKDERSVC